MRMMLLRPASDLRTLLSRSPVRSVQFPHFWRLVHAHAFKADPIEITVNIAIFSPTEMAKPAKKRTASSAGFMKTTDDLAFRLFERKLTTKIMKLASLGYTPDDDDMRVTFSVPRHITQPLAIDNADSYQHMLSNAKKCKDPTVNIAVELQPVRRECRPESS